MTVCRTGSGCDVRFVHVYETPRTDTLLAFESPDRKVTTEYLGHRVRSGDLKVITRDHLNDIIKQLMHPSSPWDDVIVHTI